MQANHKDLVQTQLFYKVGFYFASLWNRCQKLWEEMVESNLFSYYTRTHF